MYKKGGIYRKMFQKGGHGPAVPPPKSATGPGALTGLNPALFMLEN